MLLLLTRENRRLIFYKFPIEKNFVRSVNPIVDVFIRQPFCATVLVVEHHRWHKRLGKLLSIVIIIETLSASPVSLEACIPIA